MTRPLASFLERRFRTAEELEGKPKFLDKTVLVSPSLAYKAVCLELGHVAGIVQRMAKAVVSAELAVSEKLETDYAAVQKLVHEVESFVSQLGRAALPADVAMELSKILRTSQYLSVAAELAHFIADAQPKIKPLEDQEMQGALAQFRAEFVALVGSCDLEDEKFSLVDCDERLEKFDAHYHELKEHMLTAGARQRIRIRDMSLTNEQMSRIRRLAEQMVKATRVMAHLMAASSQVNVAAAAEEMEPFSG